MQQSSSKTYQHHWERFEHFIIHELQETIHFPIPTKFVALFIAHLYSNNLQYSTIRNYISAISFMHKIQGSVDNTSSFIVNKALKGISRISQNTRPPLLPITKTKLNKILKSIPFSTNNKYKKAMYRALYLLSYHACLRAGKVVHSNKTTHTIQIDQIEAKKQGYHITLKTYKHSNGKPTILKLTPTTDKHCPVKSLREYVTLRGNRSGPLFIKSNKKPLTRTEFSNSLKDCLELAGLPSERFNTHSFRIGRATQLAQDHTPESIIKSTSRWKSTAFLKYIRPKNSHLPS